MEVTWLNTLFDKISKTYFICQKALESNLIITGCIVECYTVYRNRIISKSTLNQKNYLSVPSASFTFAYTTTTADGSSFMHSTPSRMIFSGFPLINLLQKETKDTFKRRGGGKQGSKFAEKCHPRQLF